MPIIERDPAGLVDSAHIRGRVGDLEIGRILGGHALHEVDLLDRGLHRLEALDLDRYPDRPELTADHAGAQPRNIRHQRGGAGGPRQLGRVGRKIDGGQAVP